MQLHLGTPPQRWTGTNAAHETPAWVCGDLCGAGKARLRAHTLSGNEKMMGGGQVSGCQEFGGGGVLRGHQGHEKDPWGGTEGWSQDGELRLELH